jgi:hypothetical protein
MSLQDACRVLLVAVSASALVWGACGGDDFEPGPKGGAGGEGGTIGPGGMIGMGGSTLQPPDVTPCGESATPPDIPCPDVCSGGCADGVCLIDCSGEQSCNSIINCPEGLDCQVTCSGNFSCRYQIVCDDYYKCTVGCTAPGSCTGAEIVCGEIGDCHVTCAVGDACNNADITCGDGDCTALCFGTGNPVVDCSSACSCNDTCSGN